MGQETVLYNDNGVRVTTARATLGGRTYAMANVTSVHMAQTRRSRWFAWLMIIATGFWILVGITGESGTLALAVFAAVVASVAFKFPKDTFHVHLGSASGESEALTSTDAGIIQAVVDAVNEAIVQRG